MGHKWDNGTREVLERQPDWVHGNLVKGLKMRSKARKMETDVKELKSEGNALLQASMEHVGVARVVSLEIGTATLKAISRETLNKDEMIDALLASGVSVNVINKAVKKATRNTEFNVVDFRPV